MAVFCRYFYIFISITRSAAGILLAQGWKVYRTVACHINLYRLHQFTFYFATICGRRRYPHYYWDVVGTRYHVARFSIDMVNQHHMADSIMIKIFDRYIIKTILLATLFVTLVIMGILILIMLLGELKYIGEGDYDLLQVVGYVLMRLPNELYRFSPILILLGGIIGLNILSTHRELIVMRTAGYSTKRIIGNVLGGALLLVLIMGIIGEGFAPHLSYKAEVHKESAKSAGQAVVTAAGIWFHIDNNFMHVQQIIDRQLLEGVTWYEFDNEHRLQTAYYAKTLSFDKDQWKLKEVVKTQFTAEGTKSQSLPVVNWNLKFNTNLLNVGLVDANDMSLPKLAKFADYLSQNGLQAGQYQYEFWQRVFQPWISLLMVFLALPFALNSFNTATLGWRLIAGILLGFALLLLNALLGQLCIVYQVPAIYAAFLPLLIFTLLGIVLVNRYSSI